MSILCLIGFHSIHREVTHWRETATDNLTDIVESETCIRCQKVLRYRHMFWDDDQQGMIEIFTAHEAASAASAENKGAS